MSIDVDTHHQTNKQTNKPLLQRLDNYRHRSLPIQISIEKIRFQYRNCCFTTHKTQTFGHEAFDILQNPSKNNCEFVNQTNKHSQTNIKPSPSLHQTQLFNVIDVETHFEHTT
jgi:hypothetical protein